MVVFLLGHFVWQNAMSCETLGLPFELANRFLDSYDGGKSINGSSNSSRT